MALIQTLSFRHKILITHLLVFLISITALFPFAAYSVKRITKAALLERADDLIQRISNAPDDQALIRRLRDQRHHIFFRVSIIGPERNVMYDSAASKILGESFSPWYIVEHPEVEAAFATGVGFDEGYSSLLEQDLAYLARGFQFQGKTYVLRTAFPLIYVAQLTRNMEVGLLVIIVALLALSTTLTWILVNYLTRPIQDIIKAVKPYQEGLTNHLSPVNLTNTSPHDDIGRLATTLNSLSSRVQNQIDTLVHERNEKEAILESLVEGVVAVNPQNHVTYANTRALQILGIPRHEILGRHFSVTNHPAFDKLLSNCQSKQSVLTDAWHTTDGAKKTFNVVAAPKAKRQGAILILQDISSHLQAVEMTKDFIANASHELKTPITIIRGFAESLHDNPDLPVAKQQEITHKIVTNSQRMASLVKDLLTLAEIENITEINAAPCELEAIIGNCIDIAEGLYNNATIKLSIEGEPPFNLRGSPDLLETAFLNLLTNAAKYSDGPAQINISVVQAADQFTISITDRGIGIPQEDLPHLFQRFYTVDKGRSRKLGGSGLGLSIVETIIERHGGRISVTSEVGVGTSFKVILPV